MLWQLVRKSLSDLTVRLTWRERDKDTVRE